MVKGTFSPRKKNSHTLKEKFSQQNKNSHDDKRVFRIKLSRQDKDHKQIMLTK